ncbi:hypothetical protein HHI36_012873 [Cryptolaemus montrouzieri]|uniref:NADPH:adrenodoxin oxidoreductase, mitochondrial n=1 Tax=Cryptolaemus montrouzieri TaxID=559131 RepID=A0ABD2NFI7_9CUCU
MLGVHTLSKYFKMKKCLHFIGRTLSSQFNNIVPKISVVGSGPAGFYAAQYLLKKLQYCEIDIFEQLPVPFGLVRFGVAPDHPEVKNVENSFSKVGEHPNVRFLGNVNLGNDITVEELRKAYHIVILAYGSGKHRCLNIQGENIKNVISAQKIVGWYNGVPWDSNIPIDLSGEVGVIFGQGNVALDVARILLKPVDELKKTDITQHALEALSNSNIKTVYLIGRRGPLQAAFTIKELREMLNLKNCQTEWISEDFEGVADLVTTFPRPKKRICELMLKSISEKEEMLKERKFKPLFFRTPLKFIGDNSLKGVELGVNEMQGEHYENQKAVLSDLREKLDCDLAVVSIGYKSTPVDPCLDFDAKAGIIKSDCGKLSKGLYATGWLATGATGVILTTMNNSFRLADSILKDIAQDSTLVQENRPGYDYVKTILDKKNIQIVTWTDWLKINDFEIQQGLKFGKSREKIVNIQDMLKIASS